MLFNVHFVVIPQHAVRKIVDSADWISAANAEEAVREVVKTGLAEGKVPKGRVAILSIYIMEATGSTEPGAAKYAVAGQIDPREVCDAVPQAVAGSEYIPDSVLSK